MEGLWLIFKADELQEAGPGDGEICESDNFIHEDKAFGVVLFVVVDEEVFVFCFLVGVLGVVN